MYGYVYKTTNLLNNKINSLKEATFVKYEQITGFDEKKLNLNKTSSKNDWIKESKRLEKVGQISKSKFARNKAEEQKIIDLSKISDNSEFIVVFPNYDIKNL